MHNHTSLPVSNIEAQGQLQGASAASVVEQMEGLEVSKQDPETKFKPIPICELVNGSQKSLALAYQRINRDFSVCQAGECKFLEEAETCLNEANKLDEDSSGPIVNDLLMVLFKRNCKILVEKRIELPEVLKSQMKKLFYAIKNNTSLLDLDKYLAYERYGTILYCMGDFEKAKNKFRKAIKYALKSKSDRSDHRSLQIAGPLLRKLEGNKAFQLYAWLINECFNNEYVKEGKDLLVIAEKQIKTEEDRKNFEELKLKLEREKFRTK